MTITLHLTQVFPLRKGSEIEAFIAGPTGEGLYIVQEISVKNEGLIYRDYRHVRVIHKVTGTVLESELSNYFPSNRDVSHTYIELENEKIEKLTYPHFLPKEDCILVTNLLTKKRQEVSFKGNETYAEIITKYGALGSKDGFLIVDADLNDIGDNIIAENPILAYLYPAENEDEYELIFEG